MSLGRPADHRSTAVPAPVPHAVVGDRRGGAAARADRPTGPPGAVGRAANVSRRRPSRGITLALAAVVLVGAGLAGCSSSSDAKTITVYSGRSAELIAPLLEKFSEQTGISVDFKTGDSPELAQVIAQEGDASPADVFISQNPGATSYLDGEGRLGTLPQATLDKVAPDLRSADGSWVGVSGRVRVLVYNKDAVSEDELPLKVTDLTQPQYEGRVALAPSNGSFQDFVTALRVQLGEPETEAWLQGMADNGAKTYANNNAIVEAVGRGEVDMGLVNHYYNVRALEENPDLPSVNYFFPDGDPGSLMIVSSVTVLKTSKHPTEAQQLVDFLLTEESQKYFADETDEYPVLPSVPLQEGLPPLDTLETDRVDFDQLGGGFEKTIEMIAAAGLE
jgi:iron(III) transport system substrate-binding protein